MKDTEQKLREALQHCKSALRNWIAMYPESKDALDVIALDAADTVLSLPTQAEPAAQEAVRDSDRQLMSFYSVDNLHELIDAQEKHITKLQAKQPRDNQTAFTQVREG